MMNMQLSMTEKNILDVRGLRTYFFTSDGVVQAVDDVHFSVQQGEVFGLVGESGCGKSVTSLSILRLVDKPGKIVSGEILFDGTDLLTLSKHDMVRMRGSRISMIFQQPQSSLNPVFKVGAQLAEVFEVHENLGRTDAWNKAVDLLQLVGIPDPEKRCHAYPHEMSGGQAQRVMIAMALALKPQLLIADEPSTALDVTIQAQILDLIRDLVKKMKTSVILITHDLGVIAEMVDRVAVMYAGQIVEQADVDELFENPKHPYTQGLIESVPTIGREKDLLEVIPGTVPNLVNLPQGCRFAPRCRTRQQLNILKCTREDPELISLVGGHMVRCWLYE
jgi:oligopeptide/dipeptide ABC transporter ATP-binding protein